MMIVSEITSELVIVCAAATLAFAWRLARVRWWRSDVGRQEALTAAVFVILLGLATATALGLRDYPGREWVRMGCWAALSIVLWSKYLLLANAQRAKDGTMIKTTKAKAYAAAIGGVFTVAIPLLADNVLNVGEVGQLVAAILVAAATVYAVYRTENKPTS